MLRYLIILLLTVSGSLSAQKKPYPKMQRSIEWLAAYDKLTGVKAQLTAIHKKVYSDTLFADFSKLYILDNPRDPKLRIGKNLIIVESNGKYYVLDLQQFPEYRPLMRHLIPQNILEIKTQKGMQAAALWGQVGMYGAIYIVLKPWVGRLFEDVGR